MDIQQLRSLVVLTISRPADAIVALRALDIPYRTYWTLLALACVSNAIVTTFRAMLVPEPIAEGIAFIDLISPFQLLTTFLVVAVTSAVFLTSAGRLMGGQGKFPEVLGFIAWLQLMRFLAECAALVIMLASPNLAAFGSYLAGIYGIWIVLHFQNHTHGFQSLPKAAGSLVLSFFGIVLVLSVMVFPFISINGAG